MNEQRSLLLLTWNEHFFRKTAALSVMFLGLSFFGACNNKNNKPQQEAVPVVVGTVSQKNIPYEIKNIGTVEAYNIVDVRSRVGGELKQVYFQEGQDVRKGDPLFLIDPAPYQAAMEGAKANLARDTVMARNAEESARRYAELVKKEYITQQQYDDMLTNSEALKAEVKADQATVENARLNLEYCRMTAPISGRTGSLLVHQGNMVMANASNPLVVIHQIQPIYVSFTVPEQYLSEIRQYSAAGRITVRVYSPDEEQNMRSGELSFIDNTVDTSTGTILLKAVFPNEDKVLWPGEFVNVVILLKEIENAVVIPSQAVQAGQDGNYVFVVKSDRTVESRPVTISYRQNNEVVVEKGLEPGERVVTDGQFRLYPGARITETTALDMGKANNQ
jgi:multidrug efflux system membrane fusion protein